MASLGTCWVCMGCAANATLILAKELTCGSGALNIAWVVAVVRVKISVVESVFPGTIANNASFGHICICCSE